MRPPPHAPLHPDTDWSQAPLARTWRSFSILCWCTGLVLAWLHPLPGVVFGLLGWWAQCKSDLGGTQPSAWPPRRAQRVEAG